MSADSGGEQHEVRGRGRTRAAVVFFALVAVCAAGAVVGFSVAGADVDAGSQPAEAEHIAIDGVDVYRTELPSGGPAIYDLKPPSQDEVSSLDELPSDSVGSGKWLTTGDFDACKLVVKRAGSVVPNCAIALAQDQFGDLELTEGPAQLVYTVCGQKPAPGEVEACKDEVVEEAEVKASLDELREALGEGE
jgi:hypothetical protein